MILKMLYENSTIHRKKKFQWLCNKKIIKVNADKCHFIYRSIQKTNLAVEDEEIENNVLAKL